MDIHTQHYGVSDEKEYLMLTLDFFIHFIIFYSEAILISATVK